MQLVISLDTMYDLGKLVFIDNGISRKRNLKLKFRLIAFVFYVISESRTEGLGTAGIR